MSTFVTVGNALQSFSRLLDEVARLAELGALPDPVVVQHGHTPFSSPFCTAIPFLELGEFETEVSRAELCIIHAGAGSALHVLRSGKIPVIMPRSAKYGEHVDDHQYELAAELERAGLAVVAIEPVGLQGAVQRALLLQSDRRSRGAAAEPKLISMVRSALAGWDRTDHAASRAKRS